MKVLFLKTPAVHWALILALLVGTSGRASAQTPATDRPGQLRAVLSAIDVARPVTDAEVAAVQVLLDRAEADGVSPADRRAALVDLYGALSRMRGLADAGTPLAAGSPVTPIFGFAPVSVMYGFGRRLSLDIHAPPPGGPEGQIHVVKRGHGPVPLMLVSDAGIPGDELYDSFMARHVDRYTMYAVTLPGFGEARVPPRPAVLDYSRLPWLNAAERQMAAWLVRENLKDVVVVGTAVGGYFSAALAARHPERIRAAVVVNGLVHTPLRAAADPNRPASHPERLAVARNAPPIELIPTFWPPTSREAFRALITDPPRATGWGDFMAFAARDSARTLQWTTDYMTSESVWRRARYAAELAATDLTVDLATLSRPLLVVASLHDLGSPGVGSPVAAQWAAFRLRLPMAPVTITTLADVRHYASVDAPEPFDEAVEAFLAGRPFPGTTARAPVALPSPFSATTLHIGTSEMRVEYFRPAVRGREIWGTLVPFDQLWRTGANGATTITFSHDVTVEGQRLPAGTYALATIPGRTEWTLVFNRIPWQFGVFFYDPAFDALRVTVASQAAGMREWFEIAAEPTGPSDAVVTLRWDRLAVPFRVALATP